MPAISIYGGSGNRCLDFLTGNSFGIYKLWVTALTWRDHSRLSGEEGASHVTGWRPVPFGCLQTLSPKGTGSRVIRNLCRDVGQLHVLLKQINTYLLLPVGTRRHLSVPLNIHEHPGYIGREPSWHFLFFFFFYLNGLHQISMAELGIKQWQCYSSPLCFKGRMRSPPPMPPPLPYTLHICYQRVAARWTRFTFLRVSSAQ